MKASKPRCKLERCLFTCFQGVRGCWHFGFLRLDKELASWLGYGKRSLVRLQRRKVRRAQALEEKPVMPPKCRDCLLLYSRCWA